MDIAYRNPWFKGGKGYGPEFYVPERVVDSYCGFDIYYRAGCFDVVSGGECKIQMAGINSAKSWCEKNKSKQAA